MTDEEIEELHEEWVQERDEPEDSDSLCPTCSGSGEGQYEGTTCYACKGKGVV